MVALSAVTALLALILSTLVGHQAKAIANALSLVDRPDPSGGRKLHARPTPLVGGLAVALSVIAATLLSQIANGANTTAAGHLGWFAFGVVTMTLIGIEDDRRHLPPRTRLLMSTIILAAVMYFDDRFAVGSLVFGGLKPIVLGAFGGVFSLVCVIGLLNAVNMADGKNGLVIGLGLIWAMVLTLHAPATLWPVLAAAIVSLCVLLWFNLHGRLFLGDGGSYGLSALFGLLAIDVYNLPAHTMSAEIVVLMFIVPVLDTIRLMTIRIVHKKSPFDGDRNHFHHLLADKFGWPRGLLVYLGLVGVPNLVANALPELAGACVGVSALGYLMLMAVTRRTPVVMA